VAESSREIKRWLLVARKIPSPEIRCAALSALETKQGQGRGAALFAIVPDSASRPLIRALIAYQVLYDFLDSVSERGAEAGQRNGDHLYLALLDALDSSRPLSDYYRYHPWKDDGGYLESIVAFCRAQTAQLVSYPLVRDALVEEVTGQGIAQILAINHDPDDAGRNRELHLWARRHAPPACELNWFELAAAGSGSSIVHLVLLSLAASPTCSREDVSRVRKAYFPWVASMASLLDSYVDQAVDAATGDHSYVAHYQTPSVAARRIEQLLRRTLVEAGSLPDANRHKLIVACMAAMYLSTDRAHTPEMRRDTQRVARAGGSLTRLLIPAMRLWRTVFAERHT
jgi:tetraprenyl-beta-curcumene synthase